MARGIAFEYAPAVLDGAGSRNMKAAVCRAFGTPLVIEDVTLAPPAAGEIGVRIAACAICHSDIFFADGAWGGDLPAVYGHEAAGVVEAIGTDVTGLTVGDHVVVTLIRACGTCHYCIQGMPVACEASFALDRATPLRDAAGAPVGHGLRTGGFAERVTVHASQAVAIDRGVPFDAASLLACGVITGVGAVTNTARVPPGSHVVVIGAGGVGLNSVQGARLAGAASIVAVDLVDGKLDAARGLGATHTVNAGRDDVATAVKAATGGRLADFVFVTVGAKPAFDQAYALIARTGAVVLVGMPASGVLSSIDPGTIAALNQRILGSKMGSARIAIDIPWLVSLYQQGRLQLDSLISGRYPLARINDAMDEVRRGEALRNVIVF